jgi:hypothetical protein
MSLDRNQVHPFSSVWRAQVDAATLPVRRLTISQYEAVLEAVRHLFEPSKLRISRSGAARNDAAQQRGGRSGGEPRIGRIWGPAENPKKSATLEGCAEGSTKGGGFGGACRYSWKSLDTTSLCIAGHRCATLFAALRQRFCTGIGK